MSLCPGWAGGDKWKWKDAFDVEDEGAQEAVDVASVEAGPYVVGQVLPIDNVDVRLDRARCQEESSEERAVVHGKGGQGAHQAQEGEHNDEEDSQTVEAVHERPALPVARVASHHRRWHHLCRCAPTRW